MIASIAEFFKCSDEQSYENTYILYFLIWGDYWKDGRACLTCENKSRA